MGWLVGISCVSHREQAPAQLTNQPRAASQVGDDSTAQLTLAWLKHTVREPYDRVGKKDPRWDTAARKTLDEYVLALRPGGDPEGSRIKLVGVIAHEAVKAGCNDPLIAYLDIRFGDMGLAASPRKQEDALRGVAQEIMKSDYPAIRKFFVCLRASGNLRRTPFNLSNTPPAELLLRRKAAHYLAEAMTDKTMPIEQVFDAWSQIQRRLRYDTEEVPGTLGESYQEIEKPLFENWPKESTSYLIEGKFYIDYA